MAASLWGDIYRDSRGQDREAGLELARALTANGWPGVARSRLAEMADKWPSDAEIHERLGRAHELAGAFASASESYAAALDAEPGRAMALARLAVLGGEASGEPSAGGGSLAMLRAAGQLGEVDAASLWELGLRAARAQRFDEAFDALDEALGSPDLAVHQRVEAAAALTPDPRIIPWLRAVVREDPLHTRALTLLGNAQLAAGFQSQGLSALEQAASSDPSDEIALRSLADALVQAGRRGRAQEILTLLGEELELEPEPEAGPEPATAAEPDGDQL